MTAILSGKTFQAAQIVSRASAEVVQRGRQYFLDGWRCKLTKIEPSRAVVSIHGSRSYAVEIAAGESGALHADCSCPYFTDWGKPCKHQVAAALFLEKFLQTNSAQAWENTIKTVLRLSDYGNGERKLKSELLFFSLQRRNASWSVVPYRTDAKNLPLAAWTDARIFASEAAENKLSPMFKKVPNYYETRHYANASATANQLVKTVLQSGVAYGTSYGGIDLGFVLPLLKNALVFRGSDAEPCKIPVEILDAAGAVEFEMQRTASGETVLQPIVARGTNETEEILPLDQNIEIINAKPLWVLNKNRIFPIEIHSELFAELQRNGKIQIPGEAEDEFWENYFPSFLEKFSLRGDAVEFVEVAGFAPVPRVYLTEENEQLRVELRFGYDRAEVHAAQFPPANTVRRDQEQKVFLRVERQPTIETELEKSLASASYGMRRAARYGSYELRAKITPLDFLIKYVPKLASDGFEIYGEDELKNHRLNRNRPKISFGITSGIDWFDVQANVNYGEIQVSLKELRQAIRRKEHFVRLADNSIGEIPTDFLEKYKHLFGLAEETEKGTLRVSNRHFTLLDELLAENETVNFDREFKKRGAKLKDFAGIKPQKLPKSFSGVLRPYQQKGFEWLYFLREYNFGGCLADDMGVGKTVQTLVFLLSLKERGLAKAAHLLVVPRSLVFNWQREAARFTPKLKLLDYSGANRQIEPSDFVDYDVIVTTYGVLLRDIEIVREHNFDTAILDEAQMIKNPASESAKAARLVRADNRLTLSGTPVENNTVELWSQFAFLNPGLLGNLEYFQAEFARPIERDQDETAAQTLRKLVFPFVLRRTKDEVATDLPARTERILYCEMEPAQRKFYNQKRDYYRAKILQLIETEGLNKSRFYVLEGLLRLRQICNHPRLVEKTYQGASAKFDLLLETLQTLQAENHKALVFSQFVQMLKLVETRLKSEKLSFSYLDGKTVNRQEKVDEFQTDEAIKFFLISLKAGGVGLNLTAADYVLHIDPWWNPAVEMQATDRTHRIGQDKPVFVYKFIVRDSVEEKILQLQEKKRNLVKQLISTETAFFKTLTAEDINALLS